MDKNTAADIWMQGNNLLIFKGLGSTKQELEAEWNDYQSTMDTEQQLLSDDESIRIYGKTNLERYKERLAAAPNDEETEISESNTVKFCRIGTKETGVQLDLETEEKIKLAKQYMLDNNTIIMYPMRFVSELDDHWRKITSKVSPEQMQINDTKVIELFGCTNEELYKKQRDYIIKCCLDYQMHYDHIEASKQVIELRQANTVDNIVKEYTDLMNKTSYDEISVQESNMAIEQAEEKLRSLIEYSPMAMINPVINNNLPLPAFHNKVGLSKDTMIPDCDIKTITDFNNVFDSVFRGVAVENLNEVRSQWKIFIAEKQQLCYKAKSNSNDPVNDLTIGLLEQEILMAGWHPDYDINEINDWVNINKQTLGRIKEEYYGDTKIVNLCELVQLMDTIADKTRNKRERKPNFNPVYIVLISGTKENIASDLIRRWTKGPFCHAALGLNYDLKDLVSFNNAGGEHQGLSQESLDFYQPDERVAVYTIFVNDEDYIALKKNIEFYLNNKDKTHYSKMNIVSLVFNKTLNFQYDMVCSQFVDRLLKFINVNITDKDSSLVSPNDFYRAASMNSRIYKLYDGKVENYNSKRIQNAIERLLSSSRTKYFKELALLLTETGAKLLKHKKTSVRQISNQYGNKKFINKGLALVSDDYDKAVQQHSIELTGPMMDEYDRLLAIEDDEKFVEEFNLYFRREFNELIPIIRVSNAEELKDVRKSLSKEMNDETRISYAISIGDAFNKLHSEGYLPSDIMDTLQDDYFISEKDPEKLRHILKLRQAYNRKMISMFNAMINKNYEALGIAKDEADKLSEMLRSGIRDDEYEAIKVIKTALDKNAKSFEVNPGVYDLRKIDLDNKHAGIICFSTKKRINPKMEVVSRLVQKSLEWDCIIYAHGNSNPDIKDMNEYRDEYVNLIQKKLRDNGFNNFLPSWVDVTNKKYGIEGAAYAGLALERFMQIFELSFNGGDLTITDDRSDLSVILSSELERVHPTTVNGIEEVIQSCSDKARKSIMEDIIKYVRENINVLHEEVLDNVIEELVQFLDDVILPMCSLNILDNYLRYNYNWVWTIQPIYTTKAGPFKTMDELLRELIKEGFKKILVFNCNPGGHELPPDIKNSRVLIKYSDVVTLAEGDIMAKTFDDCLSVIESADNDLRRVCLENDIDYDDDTYLTECYNNLDQKLQTLEEKKKIGTSWLDLRSIIKDIIAGITWAFKQTYSFFKSIVLKMKEMFLSVIRRDKFAKPIKTRFISIKNKKAVVKEEKVSSYDELQDKAVDTCKSISDAVIEYQKDNMKVYSRFERYAKNMDKTLASKKISEQGLMIGLVTEENNSLIIKSLQDGDRNDVWNRTIKLNKTDKYFLALDNKIKRDDMQKIILDDNNIYALYDKANNIIGYFIVSPKDNMYMLDEFIVFPEYRGQGYSKFMMNYYIENYPNSYAKSKPENKIMFNLLKQYGFKPNFDNPAVINWIRTNNKFSEQDIVEDIMDNIASTVVIETKEFPVQFDDDGNLLIKNYKKMDYNREYQHSHELLKTYDKSTQLEGMKYELARLWFVYTVLNADIYENPKLKEDKKTEYTKIKAWIMNDFTKYNKVISKADPSFNFSEYYLTTPFSDVYIKIHSSTIKFLSNLLKNI